jgi:hypothetical protein
MQKCLKDDPELRACCCTCKHHIQDFKHCTTVRNRKPGTCVCDQPKGWICMVEIAVEGSDRGRAHSGWGAHGLCELHLQKP